MYRFSILFCAAALLTSCSDNGSNASSNPVITPADSASRLLDIINVKSTAPDSTYVENLTWNENDTKVDYKRLTRHISTPDSLVYLDIVCDYIPRNQANITYVARTIDESTLTVRGLDKSNLPASIYSGDHAVENTINAIARDFRTRFYDELKADTAMTFIAQNGIVNQLIHYVTPNILTYSNYTEFYLSGAAHGMSDFELTSFNRTSNRPLGFDQIVKRDKVTDVRKALAEVMAKSDGFDDESEYLERLSAWISDNGGETNITAEKPSYLQRRPHTRRTYHSISPLQHRPVRPWNFSFHPPLQRPERRPQLPEITGLKFAEIRRTPNF